ncbi:hypothetical protein [Rhodococcus jostii]|uniref:hypothetical protein n=1 Tax=Rhodococcus jostii TaxID=132919 RepID=UPI001F083397|nr:hypothetical protein [Rhodococcus jostii]
MARYSFGTRGSKLASVLLGGTQVGWCGVIIDRRPHRAGSGLAIVRRGAAVMIAASILMCVTACYGYPGMYWVSLISIPLILALAYWVVSRSLEEVGGFSGWSRSSPRRR